LVATPDFADSVYFQESPKCADSGIFSLRKLWMKSHYFLGANSLLPSAASSNSHILLPSNLFMDAEVFVQSDA
jgi:hypothetical protein